MADKNKVSSLIVIGNEILSGRTKDVNAGYVAEKMTAHGVPLREVRVIPDIEQVIIDTVNEMRGRYDYVFTTGGIGPTHDDITALSIAKAFGVELEENAEAYDILLKHYGKDELTEARLKMAQIPVGASLIDNPVSAAPGFQIGNVSVMAGVPKIMQAMLDNVLNGMDGGVPILSLTVSCDLPESSVAPGLGQIQDKWPDIDIGSYPYFHSGEVGVSVVLRSTDADLLEQAKGDVVAMIKECGGAARDL